MSGNPWMRLGLRDGKPFDGVNGEYAPAEVDSCLSVCTLYPERSRREAFMMV